MSDSGEAVGRYGHIVINDTNLHAGPFSAFKAINADVVFSATSSVGEGDLSADTLQQGDVLPFRAKDVTRASGGKLIAYYAARQTSLYGG